MADSNMNILVNLKDRASESLKKMQGRFQNFVQKQKTNWVELTAKAYLFTQAVRAVSRVIGGFIGAADKVEQLQVRLKVLFGNVEEGNQLFSNMRRLAGEVPKEFDEIMESATNLAAVVRGGTQEVTDLMPIIVDLSAASGIAVRDVTSQMIKMYSAGASAAEMFKERGVSEMLGFKTGVSYEAEETMKQVIAAYEDADSKFRGASEELAKTWTGKVSMMKDAWFNFQASIGEFFTESEGMNWWLDKFTDAMEKWTIIFNNWNDQSAATQIGKELERVNAEIRRQSNWTMTNIGNRAKREERLNELHQKRLDLLSAMEMLGKEEISKNEKKSEVDEERKKSKSIFEVQQEFNEKYKEMKLETYEGQIQQLDELYKKYAEHIKNKSKLDEWYQNEFSKIQEKFNQSATMMTEFAKQAARNIQNAFSDFFFDAFKGELNSLSDMLRSFGDAMLKTFANLAAKKAAAGIMTGLGFPGYTGHAIGTPYIPQTGLYKLHQGERVVPAHENNGSNGGGGGVTINVNQMISTMDASDFMRRRKMISDAVAVELQNNAGIRQAIQKYT